MGAGTRGINSANYRAKPTILSSRLLPTASALRRMWSIQSGLSASPLPGPNVCRPPRLSSFVQSMNTALWSVSPHSLQLPHKLAEVISQTKNKAMSEIWKPFRAPNLALFLGPFCNGPKLIRCNTPPSRQSSRPPASQAHHPRGRAAAPGCSARPHPLSKVRRDPQ